MNKLTKNIGGEKIIRVLFFSLVLSLSPLAGGKALAWETWGSIPMGIGITEVIAQLKIVINGAAKQAAVKMINQNVYASVGGGGGGGGPKFITDWSATLTANPKKKAALYIEQLSKRSTGMKGSSFYQSAGTDYDITFEGVGESGVAQYFQSPRFINSASALEYLDGEGGENYSDALQELGQGISDGVSDEDPCPITYEGNLVDNLNRKGISNKDYANEVADFLSGNNDKVSYSTCLEAVYAEKLAEAKTEAEAEAIAYQGFKGTGSDGMISYPGSLIKEKVANVEDMGNKVIANADGIAEVITSAVIGMGMNAMNNGIGNVQAQIQKSTTNVSNKTNFQVQNQVKNYGPGALFGNPSTAE